MEMMLVNMQFVLCIKLCVAEHTFIVKTVGKVNRLQVVENMMLQSEPFAAQITVEGAGTVCVR